VVDNQHQKIKGYRDLSEDEIAIINEIKQTESYVANVWQATIDLDEANKRWANIAKTHFQEGFMALVRSIARPDSPFE
jgi:hypothetical protein